MDVVAEVHALDAEREQLREGASVGCVMPNGDGAGGDDCEAGRALEGDDGGYMGCEGVDGVEQGASMVAREAEDSDEDEGMAGKENVSAQCAEGGSGLIGGIAKRKRNRCKRLNSGQRQRQALAMALRSTGGGRSELESG